MRSGRSRATEMERVDMERAAEREKRKIATNISMRNVIIIGKYIHEHANSKNTVGLWHNQIWFALTTIGYTREKKAREVCI